MVAGLRCCSSGSSMEVCLSGRGRTLLLLVVVRTTLLRSICLKPRSSNYGPSWLRSLSSKSEHQTWSIVWRRSISKGRVHSTTVASLLVSVYQSAQCPRMHATQNSTRYSDHELHVGKRQGKEMRNRSTVTNVQEEEGKQRHGSQQSISSINHRISSRPMGRYFVQYIPAHVPATHPSQPPLPQASTTHLPVAVGASDAHTVLGVFCNGQGLTGMLPLAALPTSKGGYPLSSLSHAASLE